jgi:hypothetical protein
MIKRISAIAIIVTSLMSCTGNEKKNETAKDNKIALHTDTMNVVKLTDTLIIYESTCRGCAYENSTSFDIGDSMHIIKLQSIVTTDNNPEGMSGGNISKDIILVPQKTGTTIIKLFKFMKPGDKDSSFFKVYNIEVKN